jgi:equilibrative nucleoside transporter 1/2/3
VYRYKLLLAGIVDDPKERKLMTVDDDYEEPLLTVVEGDGASTSTGKSSIVQKEIFAPY